MTLGSRDLARERSSAITIYSTTVLIGSVGVMAYRLKRGAKTQTAPQVVLQQEVLVLGIGGLLTSYEREDGEGSGQTYGTDTKESAPAPLGKLLA